MSSLKYSRILEAASTHSATIWPYSRLKKKITLLVISTSAQWFLKHASFLYVSTFPPLNSLVFTISELYLNTISISPFLKEKMMW